MHMHIKLMNTFGNWLTPQHFVWLKKRLAFAPVNPANSMC